MIDSVSKWVQTILQHPGDSPEQPYVLKTAFTGTAASNIGGLTLTSTFKFGYGNEFTAMKDKERDRAKVELQKLVIVIIDEVSFVKSDMLYQLNLRLQEVKECTKIFGKVAIFCFGDICQLQPVAGRFVFQRPQRPSYHFTFQHQNLWNMLTVINLVTNHRQGEDGEFADFLDRVRTARAGELTEEDERFLMARVRPKGHEDLKEAAINIICTRKVAGNMNMLYVLQLPGEMIKIDAVNFKSNRQSFKPPMHKSGDGTIAKTNYMNELRLKLGAKVMLIRNINTRDSLTNGQTGILEQVVRDVKGGVKYLMVRFDKEAAGRMSRMENPQLEQKFPGLTKIEKTQETYKLSDKGDSTANLIQFPIVLSYAVTAHKCMGMTIPKPLIVNLHLDSVFTCCQAYVMLGRVQALSQLYIIDKFDSRKIYTSQASLDECENMNRRSLNSNPDAWRSPTSSIKISSLNISRLKPHMDDLRADPTLKKADLIHISETWVTVDEEHQEQLQLHGYRSFFVSVGAGKGLVTYSKACFEHVRDVKTPNFQITMFSSSHLDSIHVYRSAEGSTRDIKEHLEDLIDSNKSVIISGDFNICLDKDPNNPISCYLQQQGFEQMAKEATHDDGGRIDHLYLKKCPEMQADSELLQYSPYYSDHDALCLTLTTRVQVLAEQMIFKLILSLIQVFEPMEC